MGKNKKWDWALDFIGLFLFNLMTGSEIIIIMLLRNSSFFFGVREVKNILQVLCQVSVASIVVQWVRLCSYVLFIKKSLWFELVCIFQKFKTFVLSFLKLWLLLLWERPLVHLVTTS